MTEMPIGGKAQEVTLEMQAGEALPRVVRALEQVGKLKAVDEEGLHVKGSIRYGLQRVLVKAHVDDHVHN